MHTAAIHTNMALRHQRAWAGCLASGFKRHGIAATVTPDVALGADVHVVLGPWYALREWHGKPGVLYLDRAFWDDPGSCSLTWLDAQGEKIFRWYRTTPRPRPAVQPWRHGRRAVVLCDYGMDGEQERALALPHFDVVSVRRHPAEQAAVEPLAACLDAHDVAIGRCTTALIDAAIAGLPVVGLNPHAPVAPIASRTVRDIMRPPRDRWLNDLAWHNWSAQEITAGDAWEALTTRCG